MKKVLFASFESLPFVKTGGLADVVYALPKAINKKKYQVKVVLPLLKKIKDNYYDKLDYLDTITVSSNYIQENAGIRRMFNEGIEYLFIENDNYFNRDNVYGYDDDVSRFSFFNLAVIEMMIKLNDYPDIIHCHDYHTGLIAALCKLRYFRIDEIRKIKHVFTIHNLVYQGEYDKKVLFDLLGFNYNDYENGTLKFGDHTNFMKIAIATSDIITTVSKSYAKEIQTREYGERLEEILKYRKEDLYGIVNGIDTDLFNPKTDNIHTNYSLSNYLKGKKENKRALQEKLGLRQDENTMLIGVVSRLTFQKGLELISSCIDWFVCGNNVQLAILGTGEDRYEGLFRYLENSSKGQIAFYRGYNEALAHDMYAGLDLLLMPSLFEPCGISQLISMRYGTLPLVRETGGLKDTVEPYNEYTKEGRGFSFGPYSSESFRRVLQYAYDVFHKDKKSWHQLMKNAMKYDVSFKTSAKEYENIYEKVLKK